jgi:hypothetical protein
VLKVDKCTVGPESSAYLLSRHQLAGPVEQEGENLQGMLLKLDLPAVVAELTQLEIDLKRSEAEMSRYSGGVDHDGATVTCYQGFI